MGVTKQVIREGDKKHFPQKKDQVDIRYTGKLQNGHMYEAPLPDPALSHYRYICALNSDTVIAALMSLELETIISEP